MMAGDAAAKDQGEFVGLADSTIGVEESLLEGIGGGATTKDGIISRPENFCGCISISNWGSGRLPAAPTSARARYMITWNGSRPRA